MSTQEDGGSESQTKFLREQIVHHIASYERGASVNRIRAFALRMIVIVLGAATTLLLGIKSSQLFAAHQEVISVSALAISTTIPVLTAWDSFYDNRWLWIRYRSGAASLHALQEDLEFMVAESGALTKGQQIDIYGRLRGILDETDNAWRDKRSKVEGNAESHK